MKRLFALMLLVFIGFAHADANDPIQYQRQSTDTDDWHYYVSQPASNGNGVFWWDGTNKRVTIAPMSIGWLSTFDGSYASLTSKPTLFDGTWTSLSGKPSTFPPSAHAHPMSDITSLSTALAAKFDVPAGTTAQYVRGDGTLATLPTGPSLSINDAPGRSLVTATTSTGFQISSTRIARVCYEGSFSTTSTIGGASSVSVFLETADTNSTNPGDWTTRATQAYSNNITLAVTLNQVQANNWSMCRDVPAAKFVRIRSGSITGTASASINSQQQETLY